VAQQPLVLMPQLHPAPRSRELKAAKKGALVADEKAPAAEASFHAPLVALSIRAARLHRAELSRWWESLAGSKQSAAGEDFAVRTFVRLRLRADDAGDANQLKAALAKGIPPSWPSKPKFVEALCHEIVARAGDARKAPVLIAEMAALLGAHLRNAGAAGEANIQHLAGAIHSVRMAPLLASPDAAPTGALTRHRRERLRALDAQGAVHALALLDGLCSGLTADSEIPLPPAVCRAFLRHVFGLPNFELADALAGHLIARLAGPELSAFFLCDVAGAIVAAPRGEDAHASAMAEQRMGRAVAFGLEQARKPAQALEEFLDALKWAKCDAAKVGDIICGIAEGFGGAKMLPEHQDALFAWIEQNTAYFEGTILQNLLENLALRLAHLDRELGRLSAHCVARVIKLYFCDMPKAATMILHSFVYEISEIADPHDVRQVFASMKGLSDEQKKTVNDVLLDDPSDDDSDEDSDVDVVDA
jgi:hypothetical protein